MPGGADLTYTFPKPEMFMKFKCDVHPWMFAWVSVFDSPYYCVSDKDGKFVIKNVPPGKYTVEADHRKLGSQTQDVEVKDSDVTVNFTFDSQITSSSATPRASRGLPFFEMNDKCAVNIQSVAALVRRADRRCHFFAARRGRPGHQPRGRHVRARLAEQLRLQHVFVSAFQMDGRHFLRAHAPAACLRRRA